LVIQARANCIWLGRLSEGVQEPLEFFFAWGEPEVDKVRQIPGGFV
jgi:hypothetical protein